ncbi:MAG: hypothetical protein EZS28_032666 [Streblomastix strix]|uniref:Uncharacterized protein n=1 Tax=Streblomastix strix TaxID=222440 RepID=A0A5J4UMZ8_9EUKA|nr:MAG: hypothetical protein EZS28_032666 [Streblomastix strix]
MCTYGTEKQRSAGQTGQKQKDSRRREQCAYEGDVQRGVDEGDQGPNRNGGNREGGEALDSVLYNPQSKREVQEDL